MRTLLIVVLAAACSVGPEVGADGRRPYCASVLPISRNTNYNPATPVKSGDLDDLEDCIIGRKHAEREILIPATAFIDAFASGAVWGGNYWTPAAAGTSFYAPVLGLSAGDRITRVQFMYQRGSTGAGVTMNVFETSSVGAGFVVKTDTDAVVDSANHIYELSPIDYTALSQHFYWLDCQLTAAAVVGKLYGASVFVDRL